MKGAFIKSIILCQLFILSFETKAQEYSKNIVGLRYNFVGLSISDPTAKLTSGADLQYVYRVSPRFGVTTQMTILGTLRYIDDLDRSKNQFYYDDDYIYYNHPQYKSPVHFHLNFGFKFTSRATRRIQAYISPLIGYGTMTYNEARLKDESYDEYGYYTWNDKIVYQGAYPVRRHYLNIGFDAGLDHHIGESFVFTCGFQALTTPFEHVILNYQMFLGLSYKL